ncbi:DUF5681 domain-containing protein [Sphingomonas glaciei]|uniref:DUF5681 domain-containing protein n=1 Tax=Sphingomonas glaciei TaxID=2938948 RepID=A0ABY5MUG9_9SPHN|nr:DUF5681 domain-containing protein [Sphingomonas glaciei]UUR08135.1 DUF5681 domain-containing protein [Sphingomonas glaciei]
MSGRFAKGQSGNPAGRPRKRRPHVSAFDIIFDKTLTVTQNGLERELTVEEALQIQTYQAALKGSRMAIRAVLKMIEKRELALAKQAPAPTNHIKPLSIIYDSDSANEAMRLLGVTMVDESESGYWENRPKLATWATQAAVSRPGRRTLDEKTLADARRSTLNPDCVKWPRTRINSQ